MDSSSIFVAQTSKVQQASLLGYIFGSHGVGNRNHLDCFPDFRNTFDSGSGYLFCSGNISSNFRISLLASIRVPRCVRQITIKSKRKQCFATAPIIKGVTRHRDG